MAVSPEPATLASPDGKSASSATTELLVEGMTCGNCARHVSEALQTVPGVRSATVSLDSRQAAVRWHSSAVQNIDALLSALKAAGYEGKRATACDCGQGHGSAKAGGWQLNLWVGVLGTVPLMAGEWLFALSMIPWFQWASFVLAGIVQVVAGAPFYRGAWKQAKVGSSNMDTLVALGSTTAFVYSAWALFTHSAGHLYFMEAASIITLITIGHWVEARVSVRASGALRELMDLAPQTARKILANQQITEVAVEDLHPGDMVELRAGDSVPTDGLVVEGDSTLDESMLTGESAPAEKAVGSMVYGGTVNLNGRALVRVTGVGEQTALAHIIAAVQRAQTSRADIQRIGDRVSNVFVPVVVTIALLAGCWWAFAPEAAHRTHAWLSQFLWHAQAPSGAIASGFIIAAAVLIVACPCAMGLATPAAIMAGSNAAARRGILIRDGIALEKAGRITAVLFDKTGTLTIGKPVVARLWSRQNGAVLIGANDWTPDHAVQLASALARQSSHPLSQTIAGICHNGKSALSRVEELRGSGIQAQGADDTNREVLLRLGSPRWLSESGVELGPAAAFIEAAAKSGASIVAFSRGTLLETVFVVRDELKPGAPAVVKALQSQGLHTYLITGDNQMTSASIARSAGVPPANVFAEVRPERKAELVKEIQSRGERVAFVGDGINDAPALEQADLGIAVSRASDVAREAADIILLKSEIEAVPESLALAQRTLRTIKQNLFWAFFYNAVGIPFAALGLMSPILCAAAMGFSDIIVIGNALRLLRFRPAVTRNSAVA